MIYNETVTSNLNLLNPQRSQAIFNSSQADTLLTDHGAPTEIADVTSSFTLTSVASSVLGILGASSFALTSESIVQSGCLGASDFTLNSVVTLQMMYNPNVSDDLNLISISPGVRRFSYIVPVWTETDLEDLIRVLAEYY